MYRLIAWLISLLFISAIFPICIQWFFHLWIFIWQGIKVKLDHEGNIFVKKITDSPVYVRGTGNTPATGTCQSEEVTQLQGQLETGKPAKVCVCSASICFCVFISTSGHDYLDAERASCLMNTHWNTVWSNRPRSIANSTFPGLGFESQSRQLFVMWFQWQVILINR